MPLEVILPRVDMDMATGRISKWHVREGETVARGAPIFEIETDKAAMEVEAPGAGVIRNIMTGEGIDIPVGTAVAFIYGEGEAVGPPPAPGAAKPPAPAPARQEAAVPAPPPAATAPSDRSGPLRATPLARRLARERGIPLPEIAGTGPGGRIQAGDVRSFRDREDAAAIMGLYRQGSYDIEPVSAMRRAMADRLVRSKRTVPHFYLTLACDLTRLLETRHRLDERAPPGPDGQPLWSLSVDDFVVKALALALRRVPDANVTWTEAGILKHRVFDVGVAVAAEGGGLSTPVVRSADEKPLSRISLEMKDLAARARAGRLQPADCRGGTTAIANLGMYGIEEFAAIIDPPQATVLAVGAAGGRPAVVDGRIVARTQMTVTLSCDHRAVDGALGAGLLAAFRLFIEDPALMLA
ncbi:MAG: dihydrolipoamide acetyltransferase family protein [Parvibaculaceae bacterium]